MIDNATQTQSSSLQDKKTSKDETTSSQANRRQQKNESALIDKDNHRPFAVRIRFLTI